MTLAPASTIIMASFVPDKERCNLDFSLCSLSGLMTYLPSTKPTTTEPVGPAKGISEIERAIEEPTIPHTSGGMLVSTLSTVAMTVTSL